MGYGRGDRFPFDFLNQMEFHSVQNQNETGHHGHIPFNLKGNIREGKRIFLADRVVERR